jgi:hypothetical protein
MARLFLLVADLVVESFRNLLNSGSSSAAFVRRRSLDGAFALVPRLIRRKGGKPETP